MIVQITAEIGCCGRVQKEPPCYCHISSLCLTGDGGNWVILFQLISLKSITICGLCGMYCLQYEPKWRHVIHMVYRTVIIH
jgi:hypothetical protein